MLALTSTHFQEAKISSQRFCCHRTQEKPPLKAMWKESHKRVQICWECYLPWKEAFSHCSFTVESTLGICQRHGLYLLVANIDDSKKKKGEIKLQENKIYTDKGEKEVYRSSPCLWHQLSCCIPLCPLFVEPRVGKAQAKRLERDLRSRRNFRQVYSLLVGTAAITQPLSRLAQRTYCSSLLS